MARTVVRVVRDPHLLDEVTTFDEEGCLTEIVNPCPATVRWLQDLEAREYIKVEEE